MRITEHETRLTLQEHDDDDDGDDDGNSNIIEEDLLLHTANLLSSVTQDMRGIADNNVNNKVFPSYIIFRDRILSVKLTLLVTLYSLLENFVSTFQGRRSLYWKLCRLWTAEDLICILNTLFVDFRCNFNSVYKGKVYLYLRSGIRGGAVG